MKQTYYIKGMSCYGCIGTVEKALSNLDTIHSVKIDLDSQQAQIESDEEIPFSLLEKALEKTNYSIHTNLTDAQTYTYFVKGMSCSGCENTVREALQEIDGVEEISVDAKEKKVVVRLSKPISFAKLSRSLEGTHYSLHKTFEQTIENTSKTTENTPKGNVTFYCPMQCEGDKTYDKMGDCPICGMDLVEEVSAFSSDENSAESKKLKELRYKFWGSVAFTIPIFIIAMSEMIPNNILYRLMEQKYWNWVQCILSLPVVFYFCNIFFVRAWKSLKSLNFNMFTLIGIGAGIAWIFSVIGMLFPNWFPAQFKTHHAEVHVYFEATTVILTLVMLGQLLEASAHGKTQNAIKMLLSLAPNTAIKISNGQEKEVSISEVVKDDFLRVKPGDKIPVDGIITQGTAIIDESMITGEPIPVEKQIGDPISAGTINGTTSFIMQTKKVGAETLLSQIIDMVQKASRSQAPIQKLADTISSYFVPIVIIISILTFVLWIIFGKENAYTYALVNAIAVLIIACPCALGLATPMSVMVGIGKGAQNGILIKNAEALERMNAVDTLVIDKTGTITEGKPNLEKIIPFGNHTEKELLTIIYSLNKNSEHPLAKATNEYALQNNITSLEITHFKAISGKGVSGTLGQNKYYFGNDKLIADAGVLLPISINKQVKQEQQKGKTLSFLVENKEIIAAVVISDPIKPTTISALKNLQTLGIEIIMLTGDNPFTAKAIADEIGLKNYKASMLPQDKQNEIEKLQQQGKIVAMAGDGINDAPALAQANVGIAMGTGTDVAIESAKITLVKGDLNGIVKVKKLSHYVVKNIKQNLFFAMIYNTIGIPIAAGILFPFFGILLSPMLGALAMSFSSVSVIVNALRLRNVKL
ncbi:heavy metal translocating P-type ATPase [Capnocytophaga cynodegmi]|uniref:heavy metal translocating P-type ATPase n=1 Tax=Capnocytophaga cynodegmi TaxID=28189 RepID=UPI00385C79DC